ncbi:hypothetical protein [Treponema pedis]|uniref:Uncharacterized protein n=1 Tax=Treponema pedis TaxID=409322 RepID=A0A7S6WQA3_9SPIR|nr:hypothetical protein [Treponema pedis]QOW61302.1 hypothetical protein IFE08_02585 [Treponema pedis]
MNNFTELQIYSKNEFEDEDFKIEYEVLPSYNLAELDECRKEIYQNITDVDKQLEEVNKKLQELNSEIDRLTNHADGFDYAAAVICGLICGIIDIIFVGKWDFKNAKAASNKQVNEKVMEFAKKQGYEGDRLDGAVNFLEKKFPLPGDDDFHNIKDIAGNEIITTKTHHLDDFCHHPTLIGLICCVIVQFTGSSVYSDKFGTMHNIPVTVNEYGNFVGKNPVTKLFSGIINWFLTVAKTMANRKGHLMSDMAGSHVSAGGGSGVPGKFMSFMKELAALPCFKDTNFNENLRKAFQNGIGTGNKQVDLGAFNKLFEGASSKLDMRTEMAVAHELKRQAIPVVINEVLVRGFYFVRRLCMELKEKGEFSAVDWKKVIPFNNRTIVRMMTIATGTFTAVDLADAVIEGAIDSVKEGGPANPTAFFGNILLRVNFVGVGRFCIAVATDVGMGIKRSVKRNERIKVMNEQLHLTNAKIFYKQADKWISAQDASVAIDSVYAESQKTIIFLMDSYKSIEEDFEKIDSEIDDAEILNTGLKDDLSEILQWG